MKEEKPIQDKLKLLIDDAKAWNIFFGAWWLFSPNEIPFWVIDYDPKDELIVRGRIADIAEAVKDSWKKIYHCDLYEAVMEVATNYWKYDLDRFTAIEEDHGFEYLAYQVIKSKVEWEAITNYIKEKSEGSDIVIMSRIWTARPFLRVHNLLNNLIESLDNKPAILFYPGEYTHIDKIKWFRLFGKFLDAHYYSAFRLYA